MGVHEKRSDTDSDPSDLGIRLLTEWWIDSINAMVDSLGSSMALNLLRPHYKNAGISAVLVIKDSFDLNKMDKFSIAFCLKNCYYFLTRSDPRIYRSDIRENGGIARVSDCPFKNGPIELCMLVCETFGNAAMENFFPDYEIVMTSKLSRGDSECVWVKKPKSWDVPINPEMLGDVEAELLPGTFSKQVVNDFSIQYLAELWVISSRAFIFQLGSKRAETILGMYMRHGGNTFGLRSLVSSNDMSTGLECVNTCIGLCYRALQIEVSDSTNDGKEYEQTITKCPFNDAPPAICTQFESFCQGICEAIDPESEFVYDRMMTRGDETCHWTLRKKNEKQPTRSSEPTTDDPVKRLIAKYVEGEISEDDFRRKMEILRDYEIVKK